MDKMSNNIFTDDHFKQIMSAINSTNEEITSCPASYDGSKDSKAVEAFIFAIIIYKTVKQISDDEVIEGLSLLLHGDAAKWWQEIKSEVHSWEEFKKRLRSSLKPTNPTQSNETPTEPAEGDKMINPTFTDEHLDQIISAITSSSRDMSSCPASYDGSKDSKAVEAFIYAILIYKTVKRIPDDEVIEGLPLLLHGDAVKWWQEIKNEVKSWQEFQHRLVSSLIPTKSNETPTAPTDVDKIGSPSFTEEHFEKIISALASNRGMSSTISPKKSNETPTKPAEVMYQELFSEKQGTSISTESFIAKKRKIFSMLPEPAHSEERQLNMIYGLLHENIRHKIPRREINSYDQLLEQASKVERELWLPTIMEYDNAIVERSSPANIEVDTLPQPLCDSQNQQDGGRRIKLIRPYREAKEVRRVQLKDDYIQMVVQALEIRDSEEFTAYFINQGYLMHNGLLYKYTPSSEMVLEADFAQLVVPEIEWERMVSAYHDTHHYNSDIVYEAISKRYFWKKMQEYIDAYVRKCARCQRARKYNMPPVIYFN